MILSLFVFFGTQLLVAITPGMTGLIYSLMFINFYYAFVIMIGASLFLIKPVRRFFEFHRNLALKKGREIAIRHSNLKEVTRYRIGSNPFVDEVLDEIYSNRVYPVPYVQRLEIELCQNRISEIEARMELVKQLRQGSKIADALKKEKERYERRIECIERYAY